MTIEDPLLAALAKACREHPSRRKVLFLKNPGQGAAALERLARLGEGWANVSVHAPARYAEEILFHQLDRDPLPPGSGPAVAAMLLAEDIPAESRLRAAGASQGSARAAWRTLCDLRMAGLRSKDLCARHFLCEMRAKEVAGLLAAYEGRLDGNRWHDDADLLKAGANAVGKTRDLLLVQTPCRWSVLESAFFKAAGRAVLPVPAHGEGGLKAMKAEASVFRAASQDAEAREIARRILGSGRPLDEVEIALAGSEYDRTVLAEFLEKSGIPFTLSQGRPLGSLRPGKALLGYLAWVESGFEAGSLERLLRSGVLTLKNKDKDGSASSLAAARVLARFSGYKGRAASGNAFKAQGARLEETIQEAGREGDPERADAARKRLDDLFPLGEAVAAIVDSASWADSGGEVRLSEAVNGCRAFLGAFTAVRDDLDNGALAALCDALAVSVKPGDRALTRMDACRLLRETALAASLGAERGRPGKVLVTPLSSAGWEGRPMTFLAGLTLANHPGRAFQDPFLLDEERKSLGGLATAEELAQERSVEINGRLSSLQGVAVFSAYAFDGEEGREAGPAALFLEAARKALDRPDASYKDFDEAAGVPVGLHPTGEALPMDDLSWWLGADAPAEARKAFPWLKDARGSAFTAFDGLVPSAAGAMDPTRKDEAVSAAYMADLAACPLRFFLKRALGIAPKEDEERDPLVWLDALERGSLLHAAYADFLRGLGRPPDPAKDERALLDMLEGKLAALRGLIPPATDALFAAEKDDLERDARLFLRKTAEEWAIREPIGFEVAFGMKDESGEALSREDPVPVNFGGESFNIRGRVDRVDKTAEGYEIVDYKTGRFSKDRSEYMRSIPALFQPAFYSRAVEALLKGRDPKAKVLAFTFLFSTRAGRWSSLRLRPEEIEMASEKIPDLLKLLKEGRFHQTTDQEECRFCPFGPACGKSVG
jgi:RecB family exonuclease